MNCSTFERSSRVHSFCCRCMSGSVHVGLQCLHCSVPAGTACFWQERRSATALSVSKLFSQTKSHEKRHASGCANHIGLRMRLLARWLHVEVPEGRLLQVAPRRDQSIGPLKTVRRMCSITFELEPIRWAVFICFFEAKIAINYNDVSFSSRPYLVIPDLIWDDEGRISAGAGLG